MFSGRFNAADRAADETNYWPAMVDVLAAALMVFIMSTYVQSTIRLDDLESLKIRQVQDAFLSALHREFASELRSGEMQEQHSIEAVFLRFSDKVLFETGKYELRDTGKALLTRFSAFLSAHWSGGMRQAQVDGHTDSAAYGRSYSRSYPTNNWELSSARATQVVLFMHELGFPAEYLSATGYADHRPIGDNATDEGRARNRRVEVTVLFGSP